MVYYKGDTLYCHKNKRKVSIMKKQKQSRFTHIHPSVKAVSLLLSILLFFSACPPISFAFGGNDETEAALQNESVLQSDAVEEITYTEIPEKRDAFTKHFKRSDGKYVAIVYSEAVHTYRNGGFINLDNRLLLTEDGRYQTAEDAFCVSFTPNASGDELVSISFEGYTLSWRVNIVRTPNTDLTWQRVGTSTKASFLAFSSAPKTASASSVGALKDIAIVDAGDRLTFTKAEIESTFTATSGMTYRDAFSGNGNVDLVYTVTDNRLEEDIIVNEKGDIQSYVVTMNAPNLIASLANDNSVIFCDASGKEVFSIGAPWMCDAVYALSHDINVSLVQKENTVTIVYTPDSAWMNAPDRVYPVMIDPSVRSRNYTANYQDTFVFEGCTANTARGNVTYMRVGKSSDGANEAYIKLLNYPMALDAVTLHSATFKVYGNAADNLKMKVITTPWDQSTITYDNRPLGTSTVYTPTNASITSALKEYSFNLMPAITEYEYYHSGWTGFFTDYLEGFRLYRDPVGTSVSMMRSSELTDPTYRPFIEIVYDYTHDIPITSGGIYTIRNAASDKSLMSHPDSTNVFQYISAVSDRQAFKLVGANGVFTFESIIRAGEGLTYDYSGSNTQNVSNVYTAAISTTLADKQEWMFQYVDNDEHGYNLYAIVSRADSTMALTAVGTANGSFSSTGVTASGNVIASTYTGSDSQLWYLESGTKPVFSGYDIVARNGETFRFEYGVAEIFQPYCHVTTYGERITWSTSNAEVVSIAANGKVTVTGMGKATLTATVRNANGVALRSYSYTVIIGIGNGVYYIKNVGTGKYLGIPGETYANGADACLSEKYTTGFEQYGQLWKIYHIGNGLYSIRLLSQLNMGLDVTSGIVDVWSIGLNDTNVPGYAQWDVRLDDSGDYVVRQNGSESKVLTVGENTITVSAFSDTSTKLWQFEEYDINEGVILLDTPAWLAPEETGEVKASVYSELITAQGVTLTSNNAAVARIDNNKIVGVSEGTAKITVTSSANSGLYTSFWISVTPLENGVYIFENKETRKAIQPDDDGANHIEQLEFDSDSLQLWIFSRVYENYYHIINKNNNLYMTSPASDESDIELTVEQYSSSQSRQLWKIISLSDQSFLLQSQKMEEYSLVMVVGDGLNVDGINIMQGEYINDSDSLEQWYIWNTNVESFVPCYNQVVGMWCWVTSAQMMVHAMYPELFDWTDEDAIMAERRAAVYYVFGDDSSNADNYDWELDPQGLKIKGGIFKHVGEAAAYFASTVGVSVTFSASATPYYEEYLVALLSNGYPICRLCLHLEYNDLEIDSIDDLLAIYSSLEPNIYGHVTVISGCRWDEATNQFMFTVNDPLKNPYELSYSNLILNYEEIDDNNNISLWYPAVVVKTDFAAKTLVEEGLLVYEYES